MATLFLLWWSLRISTGWAQGKRVNPVVVDIGMADHSLNHWDTPLGKILYPAMHMHMHIIMHMHACICISMCMCRCACAYNHAYACMHMQCI